MKNNFLRQYEFLAKKEKRKCTISLERSSLHLGISTKRSLAEFHSKISAHPSHPPITPENLFLVLVFIGHRSAHGFTEIVRFTPRAPLPPPDDSRGFLLIMGSAWRFVFVCAWPQRSHVTGSSTVRLHKLLRAHDVTAAAMRNADWVNERGLECHLLFFSGG